MFLVESHGFRLWLFCGCQPGSVSPINNRMNLLNMEKLH
jgi:hypothetical protein